MFFAFFYYVHVIVEIYQNKKLDIPIKTFQSKEKNAS